MLPRVLKGFSVMVDGTNYVGRIKECKLPDLKVKADAYRGGGMDTEVDLDMGMEKLDCELMFAEHNAELMKTFGLWNANTPIVLRGAIQRQGEEAVAVEVRLQGGTREISRDNWKPGESGSKKLMVNCNLYIEKIAGEEVVNIDVINMKRVIGGVDQLAGMRAAIGV